MRIESTTLEPELSSLADEAVIARVQAGETAVFEVIMRRYNQRLYRAVRAILKDDSETEDAMQDAYVQAYRHLNQFRGQAAFSTWLTRIAINEALSRLRKRTPVFVEDDQTETDMSDYADNRTPSPEKQLFNAELGRQLESAMQEMPLRYRSVLMLRDVQGLTTAEAAECLGITIEAAKVSLHRARTQLRHVLEKRCGEAVNQLFAFPAVRCNRVVAAVLVQITRVQ